MNSVITNIVFLHFRNCSHLTSSLVRLSWETSFLLAVIAITLLSPHPMAWSTPLDELKGRIIDVEAVPRFSPQNWIRLPTNWINNDETPALTSADLNGDGFSEVVFSNPRAGTKLYVLENVAQIEGVGTTQARRGFRQRFITMSDQSLRVLGAGDLTSDGCDEVFFYSLKKNEFLVALSDCNFGLSFGMPTPLKDIFSTLEQPRKVDIILDKNAHPDLILSNLPVGATLYRLKGDRFVPYSEVNITGDALNLKIPTKIVLADVNGDKSLDLLSPFDVSSWSTWFVTGLHRTTTPYFVFTHDFLDTNIVPINLNHDGRTDFLAWSNKRPDMGWFAVLSGDYQGIEISIPRPLPKQVEAKRTIVGDFNGDGEFDLLAPAWDKAKKEILIWVALRAPAPGISQVIVKDSATGRTTLSNEEGRFQLTSPAHSNPTITFEKRGYVFLDAQEGANTPKSTSRYVAGEKLSNEEGDVGQSIGLLGDPPGPYLCLGYRPFPIAPVNSHYRFDPIDFQPWANASGACPDGYAVFSLGRINRNFSKRVRNISGRCCRLPAPDILRTESVLVEDICPAEAIVTGFVKSSPAEDSKNNIRCTFLNVERYQLNTSFHGTFWGFSLGMRFEENRIPLHRLPLALQSATSRSSWTTFESAACTGDIFGGVFTDILGNNCRSHTVGRIEYRGLPGDPPQGTPVQIFPKCTGVRDQFNPLSGCQVDATASSGSSNQKLVPRETSLSTKMELP